MAPLLFALTFKALSVYQLFEFLFFFAFAIKPSPSALSRFRAIRWQLDDFVILEFFVHSSIDDRAGSEAEE
jgi:hypothetical protein